MFKLNNKGFGKFEVITVITLILIICAVLAMTVLGGANKNQFGKMSKQAVQFHKAVYTNLDSYNYEGLVYLEEVVDKGFIDKGLKNPFGSGYCDTTASFVRTDDKNRRYVTLRCGDYLIDDEEAASEDEFKIYKVGKWSSKKLTGDNIEEKELYNCKDNGKDVLEDYAEGGSLVLTVNKTLGQKYIFVEDIESKICEVEKKTFYRTKELVHDKNKAE